MSLKKFHVHSDSKSHFNSGNCYFFCVWLEGSRPPNKPSIEKHVNRPLQKRRFYPNGQYLEMAINISS